MQQAPAGRQLQYRVEPVDRQAPAAGGQRRPTRPAAVRVEAGCQRAHFDAGGAVGRELGDGLVLGLDGGAAEPARRRHRQPRAGGQPTAELVVRGQPAAVEVQPQPAFQRQRIRCGPGVAALQLGELEGLARPQPEGRQRPPGLGHFGLARVDRGRAFGADQAQLRLGPDDPDLLRAHAALGQLQRLHRRRQPCLQLDVPGAGPGLHDESAVVGEPRRQRAVELHRDETGQQRTRQLHRAGAAGHAQLEGGADGQRQVVVDEAGGLHVQAVAGLGGAGHGAQPQPALGIGQAGLRGTPAADEDGAEAGRYRQVLWHALGPGQAALDDVAAGRQPHRRVSVGLGDRQRTAGGLDVLRPGTGLAGQGHAGRCAKDLHLQAKARVPRPRCELQPAGPDAFRAIGQRGAAQRRLALLRPGQPVAHRGRQIGRVQRCGRGGQHGAGAQEQAGGPAADRLDVHRHRLPVGGRWSQSPRRFRIRALPAVWGSALQPLLEHQPRVLAQRMELDARPVLLHGAQLAGVFEQHRGRVDRVPGHAVGVVVDEASQLLLAAAGLTLGVVAGDPAGHVVAGGHDAGLDAVLVLQPVGHHLELQLAHRAQQQHAAGLGAEDLDRALLAELAQTLAQLLGLERVGHLHRAEHFRRKEGQAGVLQGLALGDGVAELQHAVVGDADDVAGEGLVQQLALLAHEGDHRVGPQRLAGAHHLEIHAALEAARGHAHEGDAVAVGRVHIGLDLEHHAGELGLLGLDGALHRVALVGRRGEFDESVQHLLHAEVVDGRAEEHRRLPAAQEVVVHELRRGLAHQLDLAGGVVVLHAEALGVDRVVQALQHLLGAGHAVLAGREHAHALLAQVHHAVELLAHADRPGEGHDGHAQFLLDLVHQRERLLDLAVHLVDEGQDGRVAGAADLQQAAGLRLHAVGRVDHHQRGVHGGQHAVGVFGEVLVAGGVEQVDDAVAVLHLHDRAGHRDAALLFDLHPVRGGMPGRLARLHRAGDLDRAGEQQQLLGQRGLAGVGVADDGEGAAAADFRLDAAGDGFGHGCGIQANPGLSAAPSGRGAAGLSRWRLRPPDEAATA
mmetsp:Transcript_26231/g.62007  ORF Transcript_26231/g.62007 Transcript_26231/m.62007 type:complete len:1071 (-) Transcript_26231:600-3812(-)